MATFERSIDVVEASHRLQATDREWLRGIAQATRGGGSRSLVRRPQRSDELIAQTRGPQPRTIANQVQPVFREATAAHARLGERGMINARSELVVLINRLMLRPAWAV